MNTLNLVLSGALLISGACFAHSNIPDGGKAGNLDSVNGGFSIGAEAEVGNIDTVNGGIRVGKNSRVGKIDAVNGGISLDDGASADNIDTVNGGFKGGENIRIARDIDSVNGGISIGKGSSVGDNIENVNGKIFLDGVQIGGNVETVNGPVELKGNTRIAGKLIISKSTGWGWCVFDCDDKKPIIEIGPDVEITGGIRLEREVDLRLDPAAKVGPIERVYKN